MKDVMQIFTDDNMSLLKKIKEFATPSNAVSASRPLIALYGLENYIDDPIKLSLTLGVAFATDAIDGLVARLTKKENKYGAYADIFADRSLELLSMWYFAKAGMISYAIPIIFTAKGAVVDSVRIYRDYKNKDFSTPLKYGGNDNRAERITYGVVKGSYLIGTPLVSQVVSQTMGVLTTFLGLYRGAKSLFKKK